MKKLLLLISVWFAMQSLTVAQTADVTLQVDLNFVTNLHDGGAVWVTLTSDWSEYYDMTDDNADGIYSVTFPKDSDKEIVYQFSYQTGADPNSDFIVESVPTDCANDTGYRFVMVPAIDTVLPAKAFGSCTQEPSTAVKITFSVDMTNETVLNNDVQVVIKNPWIWTALTDQGNGIWSASVEVQANGTYPYTFVNGGQDNWSGEEKVSAECNFGTESAPERRVTVGDSDMVLETVEFGKCGTATFEKVNVTFNVNMSEQTVSAEGVQVVIKNPWIWTAMTDKGNGIWEATIELSTNTSYPYSYVNGAQDYWAGEETIVGDCKDGEENQRVAEVGSSDLVLPAFVFGTCSADANSINSFDNNSTLSVFPNPANNYISISSDKYKISTITLCNMDGKIIATKNIENMTSAVLDLQNVDAGLYFILVNGEKFKEFKKIVIVK